METILKVVVGSRAHGLAGPDSDWDYRGVFVVPTKDILSLKSLGKGVQHTSWVEKAEGGTDDTSWEIGHFLDLATRCNPSILEVFAAPMCGSALHSGQDLGVKLQSLLPYVWSPKLVRDAFIGYGLNQRKKMLEDKDSRPGKYAYTYLRVLIEGHSLLTTGKFIVDMRQHHLFPVLMNWKRWMEVSKGEVIDICEFWQHKVRVAAEECTHKPDLDIVNEYLLEVRKLYWT